FFRKNILIFLLNHLEQYDRVSPPSHRTIAKQVLRGTHNSADCASHAFLQRNSAGHRCIDIQIRQRPDRSKSLRICPDPTKRKSAVFWKTLQLPDGWLYVYSAAV